jgi:adenosine deaminase
MNIANTGLLRPLVQVNASEPYTFQNFLSKFETLRLFYRSPEIIGRITREAISDAANDNIRYLELRFTPAALSKAQGFPLPEVMDWVMDGVSQAQPGGTILTRLIVSINRHEPPELAEQVVRLAVDRMSRGIVGVDVAGNEADHSDLSAFEGILAEARQAGLGLSIHGGEWGGAGNVAEAITRYHADRIGHGVRVMEDPKVVALARQAGIPFEVCITSNYQSGVVPVLAEHPLPRMIAAGLNVLISTDDPSISQITLSQEHQIACEELGLSLAVIKERLLAAARAAFLPEPERIALAQHMAEEFDRVVPPRSSW